MSKEKNMSKKVAIITAAGKGIGAAIATELAAAGYQVSLLSNSGGALKLARELDGIGMTGSVTEPSDLAKLVNSTMEKFGRIDAVVNNTGHPPKGDLLDISDADWHLGLDLLILNVVRMARLVTPVLVKQGGGAMVNISTFSAFEPELTFPVSSSLRSGLASFTKLYADRYAEAGIRINNVLPGYMDNYPESAENLAKIPMKRYARVQEVAKTIRFLLSDDAGYITGQNIRVDGGITHSI
jgi:NAD(P)-dependent dehydrogenase (short-subunit alcohol dehydrogenase family)